MKQRLPKLKPVLYLDIAWCGRESRGLGGFRPGMVATPLRRSEPDGTSFWHGNQQRRPFRLETACPFQMCYTVWPAATLMPSMTSTISALSKLHAKTRVKQTHSKQVHDAVHGTCSGLQSAYTYTHSSKPTCALSQTWRGFSCKHESRAANIRPH